MLYFQKLQKKDINEMLMLQNLYFYDIFENQENLIKHMLEIQDRNKGHQFYLTDKVDIADELLKYVYDMYALLIEMTSNFGNLIPTSKQGYERAFMYKNFCYGCKLEKDDRIIGFCNCSIPTERASVNLGRGILSSTQLNYVGHLNTIIVHRDYYRMGIGKALLDRCFSEFELRGVKFIFTTISPNNQRSLAMFKKYGFEDIKEIDSYRFDRLVLEKTLYRKV